jgi:hypothetical protein
MGRHGVACPRSETNIARAYRAAPLLVVRVPRKAVAAIDPKHARANKTTEKMVRDQGISQERLFKNALELNPSGSPLFPSCIGLYGVMGLQTSRPPS